MKRLDSYANSDLVALTEEEVSNLIDLECMCDGVPLSIVPQPVLKSLPEIEDPSTEVYTVDNYTFKNKDEADSLVKLLQSFKSRVTTDYNYNNGSQYRYFKPYETNVDIKKSMVYSLEEYTKIEDILRTKKGIEEYNSRETKEYNNLMSERRDTINAVITKIDDAKYEIRKINNAVDIYNKYLELSGGDTEIAKKFFIQNEKVSEYFDEVINIVEVK